MLEGLHRPEDRERVRETGEDWKHRERRHSRSRRGSMMQTFQRSQLRAAQHAHSMSAFAAGASADALDGLSTEDGTSQVETLMRQVQQLQRKLRSRRARLRAALEERLEGVADGDVEGREEAARHLQELEEQDRRDRVATTSALAGVRGGRPGLKPRPPQSPAKSGTGASASTAGVDADEGEERDRNGI